ncbi:MAG: hypothetical protein ACP6IP_10795, partial [Candidatus Njordarchaeia archaeon]
ETLKKILDFCEKYNLEVYIGNAFPPIHFPCHTVPVVFCKKDPLRMFIQIFCKEDPDGKILFLEFFLFFNFWLIRKGYDVLLKSELEKRLNSMGFFVKVLQFNINGEKRKRLGISGLRWSHLSDYLFFYENFNDMNNLFGLKKINFYRERREREHKQWTDIEDWLLLSYVDRGLTIEEMAKELQRTPYAVRCRLEKIGKRKARVKELILKFDSEYKPKRRCEV